MLILFESRTPNLIFGGIKVSHPQPINSIEIPQFGQLRLRIRQAQLPPAALARLAHELDRVAQVDGRGFDPDEAALILCVTGEVLDTEMAPFESLWREGEIFLSACLFVAVADGQYTIEQSRYISRLASRLGWSAARLSALESDVLGQLEKRGRAQMARMA